MKWLLVGERQIKRHMHRTRDFSSAAVLDKSHAQNCSGASLITIMFSKLPVSSFAALMALVMSNTVYALGVGSAEAESYIGQPLRVKVPLFNIKSPESLGVTLESERAEYFDAATLTAEIDRSNSQLAVLIKLLMSPILGLNSILSMELTNSPKSSQCF